MKVAVEKEMEHIGFLNTDIPSNILSRLPTKFLLGLKCVSKGWQQLISDRSFIKVQLQNREPVSGFFFQQKFQWCSDDIETITYIPVETGGAGLQQMVFDFLPEKVVLLASCNGLVCCRSCFPSQDPALYVCNPSKKKWIRLNWGKPDRKNLVALAFDPCEDPVDISTSFRLVRVQQSKEDGKNLCLTFEIYSSDTGAWKISTEICQCNDNLNKNKGIFIGGALYWLTDGDKILMFNLKNELSWLISVPVPATEFRSIPQACIGEHEGKLHYITVSEMCLQVWFLEDEFNLKWEIRHSKTLDMLEEEHPHLLCNLHQRVTEQSQDYTSPWMDPPAFKDSWLLMGVGARIFLYHAETNKLKDVCVFTKLGTGSMCCPTVLPYTPSLVPLDQA